MGLGLLGRGIGDVKFLAECGADLIVTDLKSEKELAPSLKKLSAFSDQLSDKITFHLGEHRLADFKNRDLIIKAAGVPLDSVYIAEAVKNKIPVAMSTALFVELSGAKVIGVTGTRGKSTVTQLIYEILRVAFPRLRSGQKNPKIFLGGNVRGISTLALLKKVKPNDWVVLELDSWQLQGFAALRISPQIAVFTNLLPDHLNYYGGDLDKYFADKANIFKYQKTGNHLICGPNIAGRLGYKPVATLPKSWKLKLLGEHNRDNAALAKKVAEIVGVPALLIKKVITNFGGVAGRLELVRTVKGIKIYNDTTSTTPAALSAALKALGPTSLKLRGMKSIILISGGADKGLDFTEVFLLVKKYCREVILLPGTGTDKLKPITYNLKPTYVQSLKEAVAEAKKLSQPGDLILFSPGLASFGLFKNEFDRGDQFNELIQKW